MKFSIEIPKLVFVVVLLLLTPPVATQRMLQETTLADLLFSITFSEWLAILLRTPQVIFALFWPGCWGNWYKETDYGSDVVRNEDYERITFQAADAITEMRIHQEGPEVLQGLFWFDLFEEKQAELFSFAATPDGGSLSTGVLSETDSYNVRGAGDRVRAQTFTLPSNSVADGVLELFLTEGTAADPVQFRIVPTIAIPSTCLRYRTNSCFGGAIDLTMEVKNTPASVADGRPAHPKYENSVVWQRNTDGLLDYDYEVIQIVDGNQSKLQPAYDDFVAQVTLFNNGEIFANAIGETIQPPRCPL